MAPAYRASDTARSIRGCSTLALPGGIYRHGKEPGEPEIRIAPEPEHAELRRA